MHYFYKCRSLTEKNSCAETEIKKLEWKLRIPKELLTQKWALTDDKGKLLVGGGVERKFYEDTFTFISILYNQD